MTERVGQCGFSFGALASAVRSNKRKSLADLPEFESGFRAFSSNILTPARVNKTGGPSDIQATLQARMNMINEIILHEFPGLAKWGCHVGLEDRVN